MSKPCLGRGRNNCPLIEKFACILVMAHQKLWSYFEAYKVTVLTGQPLKNVPQWLDTLG